jgi:hypothetical protein
MMRMTTMTLMTTAHGVEVAIDAATATPMLPS